LVTAAFVTIYCSSFTKKHKHKGDLIMVHKTTPRAYGITAIN
jgi:hypothetical protein